jgi:hypothetical protein
VVPGWSLSTATWTSSASRYIRGSPRPRLPGAVGPPTVVGDGDDDVIVGALSGELDVAQSPLVCVFCGVDQCLVEAKARSSAAAFYSPVVRAQFAKRPSHAGHNREVRWDCRAPPTGGVGTRVGYATRCGGHCGGYPPTGPC